MRSLKSNAELEMLIAFKSCITLMFLCCCCQRASPLSPFVVGQAAPWFRESCAIVDLVCLGYVLPCDWRTCGVVLGPRCVRSLFKLAFDCVHQFVHLFRDADCVVCLLLSVNLFVVVWRCYLKDGTEPSQALPGHVVLAVVVARGLSERWWVLVLFTFHVLSDLTYLLLMECVLWCAAEGIALVVLITTAFFFFCLFFFAMCVSITMSDSDRCG